MKKETKRFTTEVEQKVTKFLQDEETRLKFPPMDKFHRQIVYDISETAGLIVNGFGREDKSEGRYIMLFKKSHPPSDYEMNCYRKNKSWSEEKEKQEKIRIEKLKKQQDLSALTTNNSRKRQKKPPQEQDKYKEKYKGIIGTLSAKAAAQVTTANQSFGMVPSDLKRDQRSIEETMLEIAAKKKRKMNEAQSSSSSDRK